MSYLNKSKDNFKYQILWLKIEKLEKRQRLGKMESHGTGKRTKEWNQPLRERNKWIGFPFLSFVSQLYMISFWTDSWWFLDSTAQKEVSENRKQKAEF